MSQPNRTRRGAAPAEPGFTLRPDRSQRKPVQRRHAAAASGQAVTATWPTTQLARFQVDSLITTKDQQRIAEWFLDPQRFRGLQPDSLRDAEVGVLSRFYSITVDNGKKIGDHVDAPAGSVPALANRGESAIWRCRDRAASIPSASAWRGFCRWTLPRSASRLRCLTGRASRRRTVRTCPRRSPSHRLLLPALK
jgi:hypothetical protein